MKNRINIIVLCAALVTVAQGASSGEMKRSSQSCSVSKILHADAKSKDGQNLGNVEDVLINPQTGKIDFVVLGQGGVLGMGEDRIPVPWQAVNIQSDGNLVVNQDKAKMGSAPSAKKDYSNLQQPDYIVTVYEFYAIPVPAAGGTESPEGQTERGGGSSSQESSSTSTNR